MESPIQKQVEIFFQYFEKHVSLWNSSLENIASPISAFLNLSEQLRHVVKCKVESTELAQFPNIKENLEFQIKSTIEDELQIVNSVVARLNKANQELKTKLTALENLTCELDWEDEENELIRGSATQPPLAKLLQMGYESWFNYKKAYLKICEAVKALDILSEKSVNNLSNAFKIHSDVEQRINYVLAVTQYINKEIDV